VKGGPPKQLTRADHDCSSAAVSPDGRTIAFASTDRSAGRNAHLPGRFDLCLVAASGGRVRRRLPGLQLLSAIAWSPDGAEIAYVSMGPAGDPSSSGYVWVAGRRGGAPRRLTSDELSPIAEAPLAWIGNRILFTANTRGSSGVFAVTTKAGRVRPRRAESELADGPASFSADGRRFAFTASTLRRPSEVVAHDATTGSSRLLTGVSRDYLRDRAVGRTERFAVKRGDFDIDCFLTFPPAFRRNRRYPLILMIHGGPHGFYGTGWLAHVQVLAAQGYLVLWTNPRGSSTYGSDFLTRVVEDWGGEDYLDLMAAVDRVSQRSYVDGRRLGVMGYSYGGFMTSWVIGHTNRFKSAIVGAPVTNLWSMYGTTDIGVTFGERQWGGTPWRNFDHYVEHSPLTYAPKVETPVLLLHGELDIRCPIAQSEEYYVALKRMGKRVEFVRFPGGYHGFTRSGHPAMREAYVDEIVNWWKRTL
jgi:dipeptidyl aminopeptidase/acylaminoacyl peptidase